MRETGTARLIEHILNHEWHHERVVLEEVTRFEGELQRATIQAGTSVRIDARITNELLLDFHPSRSLHNLSHSCGARQGDDLRHARMMIGDNGRLAVCTEGVAQEECRPFGLLALANGERSLRGFKLCPGSLTRARKRGIDGLSRNRARGHIHHLRAYAMPNKPDEELLASARHIVMRCELSAVAVLLACKANGRLHKRTQRLLPSA
mmetsp:Transcript_31101/g.95158  ORF Transcript_31101/g.95158 Transcript_31101/m.95158 type:complete len:207 (+) Transcript_31101:734-1354(+)